MTLIDRASISVGSVGSVGHFPTPTPASQSNSNGKTTAKSDAAAETDLPDLRNLHGSRFRDDDSACAS